MDEIYGKLYNKIAMEPPAPMYVSPKNLTIEQLQQIIDLKKKMA